MTSRRGRRDNGLDAVLWSPLRDVDPRIGEHLLDVLHAVGIAAYLEPSADVGPYTRTVFLPSPPTDRLFVDRARRGEARTLVEQQVGREGAPSSGAVPERAAVRRDFGKDLDEDAEWARIVSAFEAEHGQNVVAERAGAGTPAGAARAGHPRPARRALRAPAAPTAAGSRARLAVRGPHGPRRDVLVGAPSVLHLSGDVGLVLGVLAIAGGVALLVSRMRDRNTDDDGDDGAVV